MAEKFISLEAAQKQIDKELYMTESTKAAMKNIIRKTPAADAVEVVRCEKCLYYRHAGELRDYGLCSHPMYNNIHTFSDCIQKNKRDFCSHGKKRTSN